MKWNFYSWPTIFIQQTTASNSIWISSQNFSQPPYIGLWPKIGYRCLLTVMSCVELREKERICMPFEILVTATATRTWQKQKVKWGKTNVQHVRYKSGTFLYRPLHSVKVLRWTWAHDAECFFSSKTWPPFLRNLQTGRIGINGV